MPLSSKKSTGLLLHLVKFLEAMKSRNSLLSIALDMLRRLEVNKGLVRHLVLKSLFQCKHYIEKLLIVPGPSAT